jgi:rod shape-determining protein MreD
VRFVWLFAAAALALSLQTTLGRFFAEPLIVDLVLVVVVYAALAGGPVQGLLAGTLAGLAQDSLSTGVVGVGGLAKTVVGFLAGVVGTQFIVAQAPSRFVVFFLSTLLHAAIFMGLYELLDLRHFGFPYATIVEQALANALVGMIAFQLAELLPSVVERRRTTRGGPRR